MKLFRRILRILLVLVAVVIAFSAGALAVLTLTQTGRDNLAGIVSGLASGPGRTVKIDGLSGIWSGHLRVGSVVVSDRDGAWLVARGVAVDWSSAKLLSYRFDAERVHADRVEVSRAPKAEPLPEAQQGSFSLPVSINVRGLDFPDVALGPQLAGGVASVAAAGSLVVDADPMQVQSDLTVTRTDGRAGDVKATIDFAPGENRIDIDVRGSEPKGGIIANLLGLPGEPAVEIAVAGSGPAADWSGSGTFTVDGAPLAQVEGLHRFTDRGSFIEAKGSGAFERFLPEKFRSLLAGDSSFDLAGTIISHADTGARGLTIERASLESAAVRATASGTLDPSSASDFALEVTAAGEGAPLSFGTEEAPIDLVVRSASIRALGDGSEPNLDIAAALSSLKTNDVELRQVDFALHSDGFNLAARTGPVAGQVTAATLIIDNPTIAPLVAGQIRAGLEGTLSTEALDVAKATIRSDALTGNASGRVSLVDGSIEINLDADAASAALPAAARPVLGERVALDGTIRRDHEGLVSADPFTLRSGPLQATGTIRTRNGEIDALLTGTLADIAPLAQGASGAVSLSASAKGPLSTPDVSLTVNSDRIVAAGREITGLKLDASGKVDPANPAADVKLSGTVAGEALNGSARLATVQGRREIKGLTVSLGQNRIAGDLLLDENFVPVGTINFQLPQVGALAALALETAEGDLNGTISFTNQGAPALKLDARTAGIRRGDLSAKNVAIAAGVTNYLSQPAVSGTVKAAEVVSGTTVVSGVDVRLTQDGPWTGFDGGATVANIPARAAGRVRLDNGRTIIELASGQATVQGVVARIARASTVEIVNGAAALRNVALDVGGGSVTVNGTAGDTLNLDVALARVPVSLANNFAPGLDAAGTASGTVKVTGAAANPSIRYDVQVAGAQTSQTRGAGFGAINVGSTGEFAGGRLNFKATIGDGSGTTLRGGGSVDTRNQGLSLDFSGRVPFSFLTARLAAQGLALSGAADVSVQVSGSTASPVVSGSVRTSGARFIESRSGIAINDIAADVALGNGVATIRSLTGKLSTGGSISAGGTVGIEGAFMADLSVRLNDARYTDGRVVTATMSGDLALKGPLMSGPTLSGTINLARTVIAIPDRLPSSLSTLDVKHRNAPAAVREQDQALKPASEATGGSGVLTLDVTVNANNQIFVQGRGLDAELGGSLRLTGSTASPQATGQFDLRRGRLAVLGRRLDFTSGTITFSGSLVPYIDLAATSRAGDADVTISVSGPANNPKFTFSSVPTLPEDEVLARLIFGRSMSNLSPLQIAQLADAAATFAGVGGSSSLLDKLRSSVGIDDLDLKTDEKGGTSVSAGKYLNDRTYLSIEKGDRPGSGKATIDLEVGKGVKLRGQATDGGEAKGGIFYEREY
jgi:translocation and assembly module TamB